MRRLGLILILLTLVFVMLSTIIYGQLECRNNGPKSLVSEIKPDIKSDTKKKPLTDRKHSSIGKKRFVWPHGEKAAVSIAYDDGLRVHFEEVAPMLKKYGLRGTFYPPGLISLIKYPHEWAKVAEMGHELGNHSLFHPCRKPHYVNPAYDLAAYNKTRWSDEMEVANYILKTIDGKDERTFAIPCAQIYIGPSENKVSVEPTISKMFVAARSYANREIIVPDNLNFVSLSSFAAGLDLKTFDHILSIIRKAQQVSGWVIITFHGVGKDESQLYIDKDEHQKLISFLSQNKNEIWTAPIIEACRHLKSNGY